MHSFDDDAPDGYRTVSDREEADEETRQLEEAGRIASRRMRLYAKRRAAGDLWGAAVACPHGWYYPLKSLAASERQPQDPRAGEEGFRCLDCGSVLAQEPMRLGDWLLTPLDIPHPCELPGAEASVGPITPR